MKKYNKHIVTTIGLVLLVIVIIEITLLLILLSQGNRYAKYWITRTQAPAQPRELLYVALGDSVGVGMGASSPEKGYVSLIAKSLEQKTGRPVRVINLGRSAAKISDGIDKQLPVLKTYEPDIITVELGSNDIAQGLDENKFRRDMENLMGGLPEHAIVADLPYFGGGIKRGVEKDVPKANQIIRELANKKGLTVAPLHEITKTNDNLLIYAADYFHPNNRGHLNWFQAFWNELNSRVY